MFWTDVDTFTAFKTKTRTPEYITAIVTNTTSFTGIPGTINYESTYLSGTVTLTKGVGY